MKSTTSSEDFELSIEGMQTNIYYGRTIGQGYSGNKLDDNRADANDRTDKYIERGEKTTLCLSQKQNAFLNGVWSSQPMREKAKKVVRQKRSRRTYRLRGTAAFQGMLRVAELPLHWAYLGLKWTGEGHLHIEQSVHS